MRIATIFALLVMSTSFVSAATLNLNLAADLYEGGADFDVLADGIQVGNGTAETAEGKAFSFEIPDNTNSIAVRFTNDAAGPKGEAGVRPPGEDRNLMIISAGLNGEEWVGTDFIGSGTFARGGNLVLGSNTTVTLPITVSAADADVTGQVSESNPAPQAQAAETVVQPGCDLVIELTGYTSGTVNLAPDQWGLLAPALEATNCTLVVTGYSSTFGPEDANARIALERADAVVAYLRNENATFASVKTVSAGETTQFGETQSANRRVVLELK